MNERKAYDWRAAARPNSSPEGKSQAQGRRKRAGRFVALGLLGCLVGVLSFIGCPKRPAYIALPLTDMKDPLPVAWAGPDAAANASLFADPLIVTSEQTSERVKAAIEKFLRDTPARAVVHVTGRAAVRQADDGVAKVKIRSALGEAASPDSGLDLGDLLRLFENSPQALLVLDLVPADSLSPLGLTQGDVGQTVHRILDEQERAKHLPGAVLTSCGPGEMPQALLELGGSLFGFFVKKGLEGRANGWNAQNRADSRVSADELFAYTQYHVRKFAEKLMPSAQTPCFYGANKTMELRGVDDSLPPLSEFQPRRLAPQAGDDPDLVWTEIESAWKIRDDWVAANAVAAAPYEVRSLEEKALEAQTLWAYDLDGTGLKNARAELKQTVENATKRLGENRSVVSSLKTPPSLAVLRLAPAKGTNSEPLRTLLSSPDLAKKPLATVPDFEVGPQHFEQLRLAYIAFLESYLRAPLVRAKDGPDPLVTALGNFDHVAGSLAERMKIPTPREFLGLQIAKHHLIDAPDQSRRWAVGTVPTWLLADVERERALLASALVHADGADLKRLEIRRADALGKLATGTQLAGDFPAALAEFKELRLAYRDLADRLEKESGREAARDQSLVLAAGRMRHSLIAALRGELYPGPESQALRERRPEDSPTPTALPSVNVRNNMSPKDAVRLRREAFGTGLSAGDRREVLRLAALKIPDAVIGTLSDQGRVEYVPPVTVPTTAPIDGDVSARLLDFIAPTANIPTPAKRTQEIVAAWLGLKEVPILDDAALRRLSWIQNTGRAASTRRDASDLNADYLRLARLLLDTEIDKWQKIGDSRTEDVRQDQLQNFVGHALEACKASKRSLES